MKQIYAYLLSVAVFLAICGLFDNWQGVVRGVLIISVGYCVGYVIGRWPE